MLNRLQSTNFGFVVVAVLIACSAGCGSGEAPASLQASIAGSPGSSEPVARDGESTSSAQPVTLTADRSNASSPAAPRANPFPEVLLKTSLGEIRLRLNPEKAPQTVSNFVDNYVNRGFYDQTIVHYVDDGFMIAAGGYTTDFEAKPTRTSVFNESDNGLSNRRGTIAMARHPEYAHSATAQFFINLVDNTSLDHQESEDGAPNGYCVFGEVIQGMDVVDRIAKVQVHDREGFPKTPTEPLLILSSEVIAR